MARYPYGLRSAENSDPSDVASLSQRSPTGHEIPGRFWHGGARTMRVTAARTDDYNTVLVLIMAVLVLAPFESTVLRPVIAALMGGTFVFAMVASGSSPRAVNVAAGLAVVGVVVALSTEVIGGKSAGVSYAVTGALLSAGTIIAIARRLRSQLRVTRHTVTGALSVYLLLGLLFAYTYGAIGLVRAEGFFAQPGPHNAVSYLYFSYLTLTTVGYGDLTAGTDPGRMIAVIEALVGQLYLVTIVAVVVGNIGRQRADLHGQDKRP